VDYVFSEGARYSCKGMRIHVIKNSLDASRILLAPVRSYPNAVARNKAKRIARECWRLGKHDTAVGYDIAVVLFPGSDEFVQRRSQLDRLLRQAGLKGGRI